MNIEHRDDHGELIAISACASLTTTMEQSRTPSAHSSTAEYIDLWKFYEQRADSIKTSLFSTVTWVLGFAAAILGFIMDKAFDFKAAAVVQQPRLGMVLSAAGAVVCIYALAVLYDGRNHIEHNWGRATKCAASVSPDELKALISDVVSDRSERKLSRLKRAIRCLRRVWYQMGLIVAMFLLAFLTLFAISVTQPPQPASSSIGDWL